MPLRVTAASTLAIVVVLLASALHAKLAQAPQPGSISGHIRLTTRLRAPLPANAYPSRSIGKHEASPAPEIRNVVIYLKEPPFRGPLPVSRVELHQQNETFVPHVLAVTRGSTVDFPNDDPFFHNVFSLVVGGVVQPRALPARPEQAAEIHESRTREGVLRHPLTHERVDTGARSPVLRHSIGGR